MVMKYPIVGFTDINIHEVVCHPFPFVGILNAFYLNSNDWKNLQSDFIEFTKYPHSSKEALRYEEVHLSLNKFYFLP